MAVVTKTYAGARGVIAKCMALVMVLVGFIALMFMPSVRTSPLHGGGVGQAGVAQADAVAGDSAAPTVAGDSGCDSGCGCGDSASCGN